MRAEDDNPKFACLFPGQGAQAVGMAADLCAASERAREVFRRGGEILGVDILSICSEGPAEELNATRLSQPAIFLQSMAVLEALAERRGLEGGFGRGLAASAASGLSLGEYSALVFAGALEFEDALEVVGKRGEFMQEACDQSDGTMAAVVGMSVDEIEAVVAAAREDGCEAGVANYNSPAETVISGAGAGVEECSRRLEEAGARKVVALRVAGAYHSVLMESATRKLQPWLDELTISPPRLPFFANYSGARVEDPEEIREGLLRQIENPVRWEQCVRGVLDLGCSTALEVGPGKVLRGHVRKIDRDAVVESIGTLESLDNLQAVAV